MNVRKIVVNSLVEASGLTGDPVRHADLLSGGNVAFDEIEIDSLSRFELIMSVEEALDIELDDNEVTNHATLNGLVAFIEAKVNRAAG